MTHVSKKSMAEKAEKRIRLSFVQIFGRVEKSDDFFGEFFTPAEQIMFAKRLAIIAMLDKRVSRYRVSEELEVSPSTVDRIYRKLISEEYVYVTRALRDEALRKTLLDHLDAVMRPKFLPGLGKDRWQWLNEMYEGDPGQYKQLKDKGYFER